MILRLILAACLAACLGCTASRKMTDGRPAGPPEVSLPKDLGTGAPGVSRR